MRKDYTKLLKFLLMAVVLLLVIDWGLGSILRYFEKNMRGGERARTYYAVNRAQADVFVFGSSRALYHYNPEVMNKVLNMKVYNAGRSAQTVLYHLPVLRMILTRHTPKLVILDINENEFVRDQQKYDIVNFVLPYYRQDSSVKAMVDEVKPYYKYFSWSKILPYNSSAISMFWRTVRPLHDVDENGYAPVYGNRVRGVSMENNCDQELDFDPRIVNAFHEFVKTCKQHNVPLMVIVSPRASRFKCPRLDLERIKDEASQMNVAFLDFSSSEHYLNNTQWMRDVSHLNYEGSLEFSREVADYLSVKCPGGNCNLD